MREARLFVSRMADERAIAALLLSPPSVIAFRPIRIEKVTCSFGLATVVDYYMYTVVDY